MAIKSNGCMVAMVMRGNRWRSLFVSDGRSRELPSYSPHDAP